MNLLAQYVFGLILGVLVLELVIPAFRRQWAKYSDDKVSRRPMARPINNNSLVVLSVPLDSNLMKLIHEHGKWLGERGYPTTFASNHHNELEYTFTDPVHAVEFKLTWACEYVAP